MIGGDDDCDVLLLDYHGFGAACPDIYTDRTY